MTIYLLADSATSATQSAAWAAWGSVVTSAIALIFGYLSLRRTFHDKRTKQAELITAWWTRVDKASGEDLDPKNAVGIEWPEEAGFRVWVINNSDDAVYDCAIFCSIEPTSELVKLTDTNPSKAVANPFVIMMQNSIIVNVGTLPPKKELAFRLDPSLITDLRSRLKIEFTDARGTHWRRISGRLIEGWADDKKVRRWVRQCIRAVFP
jgi:hypothetical protein